MKIDTSKFHNEKQRQLYKNPHTLLPYFEVMLGHCEIRSVEMDYTLKDSDGAALSGVAVPDLLFEITVKTPYLREYLSYNTDEDWTAYIPVEFKTNPDRQKTLAGAMSQLRKFKRAVENGYDPNINLYNMPFGLILNGIKKQPNVTYVDMFTVRIGGPFLLNYEARRSVCNQ